MEPALLVIGLWIGGALNAVWYSFFRELSLYRLYPRAPILSLFEHYHWATILYIAGFRLALPILPPILIGIATVLLLDECIAQEEPFAIGSDHFAESLCLELIILAGWLLLELLASIAPKIL